MYIIKVHIVSKFEINPPMEMLGLGVQPRGSITHTHAMV